MGPHILPSIFPKNLPTKRARAHLAPPRLLLQPLEPRVLLSTTGDSTDPSGRPFPTTPTPDNSASVFLSSSTSASDFGAPVSLVARILPNGALSPNGLLVDFLDLETGTPVLLGTVAVSNNAATLTLSDACLGNHEIIAQIEPNQSLQPASSASLPLTVSRANTQTLVSDSSGIVMAYVTSDAAVSGGTVSFFLGTRPLATVTVNPNGTAACPPTALPAGKHKIVAAYNGAANYTPSTSPPVAVKITPAGRPRTPTPPHSWTFSPHHGFH